MVVESYRRQKKQEARKSKALSVRVWQKCLIVMSVNRLNFKGLVEVLAPPAAGVSAAHLSEGRRPVDLMPAGIRITLPA
jgi:hypothetical protein